MGSKVFHHRFQQRHDRHINHPFFCSHCDRWEEIFEIRSRWCSRCICAARYFFSLKKASTGVQLHFLIELLLNKWSCRYCRRRRWLGCLRRALPGRRPGSGSSPLIACQHGPSTVQRLPKHTLQDTWPRLLNRFRLFCWAPPTIAARRRSLSNAERILHCYIFRLMLLVRMSRPILFCASLLVLYLLDMCQGKTTPWKNTERDTSWDFFMVLCSNYFKKEILTLQIVCTDVASDRLFWWCRTYLTVRFVHSSLMGMWCNLACTSLSGS